MSFHIHQDYRKTICRLNGDEQAGSTRDQAIPDEWLFGQSINAVDQVGMNLTQGNDGPERLFAGPRGSRRGRAQRTQEGSAITLNRRARILFGESQVEVTFAVGAGIASDPRGESVHQPGMLAQVARAKNGEFSFFRGPGWHVSIITDGLNNPMSRKGAARPGAAQKDSTSRLVRPARKGSAIV